MCMMLSFLNNFVAEIPYVGDFHLSGLGMWIHLYDIMLVWCDYCIITC